MLKKHYTKYIYSLRNSTRVCSEWIVQLLGKAYKAQIPHKNDITNCRISDQHGNTPIRFRNSLNHGLANGFVKISAT